MPRTARFIVEDCCYHVINRANKKAQIFHEAGDYEQFLALIHRAQARIRVPLLAACLMPNHLHLVVRPACARDLARWMQWVFTTHVRWHHAKYASTGRLWQGRFKAFLIQQDHHLLTVLRYVERNALRPGSLNARRIGDGEAWRGAQRGVRRSHCPLLPSRCRVTGDIWSTNHRLLLNLRRSEPASIGSGHSANKVG